MPATPETVAAVDLGSNSFHMLVARNTFGEVHVVDKLRERVQLAAGLDAQKRLKKDAEQRAITCLEMFGQRLRHMPPGSVRAVGTNTLRQARNSRAFLYRAESALGHPIEVISGREEARLVYLGVAHAITGDGRRLVVDIGGGSTECIIGEGFEPLETDSLYIGCVNHTMQFFPDGAIRKESLDRAILRASSELQGIEQRYKRRGWQSAIGSSGTVHAAADIIRGNGWDDHITARSLRKLRKALLTAGHVDKLSLSGMPAERASVLPGGIAILSAVFDILGLDSMRPSTGALREGLVYDLLGRFRHEDVRDRTIQQFSERFLVDLAQAARVESLALRMLDQVSEAWDLEGEAYRQLLSWAAALHEIGLSLSLSGYHKHGAYILANADMPGFSREDQRSLSQLVLGHRRKFRLQAPHELPDASAEAIFRLTTLLRLSVCLARARSDEAIPDVTLAIKKRTVTLQFSEGWLEAHPMTRSDLEAEATRLAQVELKLRIE